MLSLRRVVENSEVELMVLKREDDALSHSRLRDLSILAMKVWCGIVVLLFVSYQIAWHVLAGYFGVDLPV